MRNIIAKLGGIALGVRRNTTRRRIGARLALAGIVGILMCSCGVGGGNVALVKKGVLEANQKTTVGEALDNYGFFRSCKWESGKTANGIEFVNAVGDLDMDKLNVWGQEGNKGEVTGLVATFQFAINRDGKTFEHTYSDVKAVMKDGGLADIHDLVKTVYDNNRKPDAEKKVMPISSGQGQRLFNALPKGDEALSRIYANEPLLRF